MVCVDGGLVNTKKYFNCKHCGKIEIKYTINMNFVILTITSSSTASSEQEIKSQKYFAIVVKIPKNYAIKILKSIFTKITSSCVMKINNSMKNVLTVVPK